MHSTRPVSADLASCCSFRSTVRHITLCAFVLATLSAALNAKPANIVLIVADDLGYGDVGFNGSTQIPTPHLDALASSGVVCRQGYVSAPVCSPSRAGFLTGRNQPSFGYDNNLGGSQPGFDPAYAGLPVGVETIADHLKERGYISGLIGKWHLGMEPQFHPLKRGFDEFWGFLNGGHTYFPTAPGKGYRAPIECSFKDAGEITYLTDDIGDEAVKFVERHSERPFFLYASFNAPHGPLQATEEDLRLFAHIDDRRRRTYCAMVHRLDVNVGRIVAAVDAAGLAENTLFVFFSDNGGPVNHNASLNAPLRGQKGILLEGGLRVPFLLRWKGVLPAGMEYDQLVSTLDCAPTFISAAGGETTADAFDGVNLLPFLTGKNPASPHLSMNWRFTISAAIRDGDWKLVRLPDRLPLLYNVRDDTSELQSVALENLDRTRSMLKRLGDWDVRLPHPLFLEGAVWRKRQLSLYDRQYRLTQATGQNLAQPAVNWPRFRGATGQGESAESDLPMKWDRDTNIAWKIPVPGAGWSSPIVYGDHVVLTTATDDNQSCRVLSIVRQTGKIRWDREVFRQQPKKKERENSYATPTPATDGERVYAVFADGSFAALDYDGNTVWTNRDAKFYSQHGLGASPIIYGDLVIMTFDGSNETGELRVGWQLPWDKSYVVGIDKRTGKQRWRTRRGISRIAHLTPTILRQKGDDLILSAAGDVIQAFHPKDGRLAWTVKNEGEGVVPSPVVGDGWIFAVSGYRGHNIVGVRTDDGAKPPYIAWTDDKAVPRVPSMIYKRPYLYSITERGGIITCRQAETGDVVWRERIGGNYYPSPIIAGDKIYFLSRDGETVIVRAGSVFDELARNPLDEPCQASPAVYGKQIFIRTEQNLYCIGKASSDG